MSAVKITTGTAKIWNSAATDYALTLTSVANGAARQGAKGDLGDPRARLWTARLELDFAAAPTAGNVVDLYWSSSPSGTAGTQNDGGASGADAAFKAGEEDEWVKQLLYLGSLIATNDGSGVIQIMTFHFEPRDRYGMPVIHNKSGQALGGTAGNFKLTLTPFHGDIT